MSILEAIPISLPLVDALVAAPTCKIATPWLIKIDKIYARFGRISI
jgi:hypothetical protein